MSDTAWQKVTAGSIARIDIGGTPSREIPAYWAEPPSGYPWVSIADMTSPMVTDTAERITPAGVSHSNVKPVPAGTPIMSFKLTVGRVAVAGVDLFTNEAIAAFHVDPGHVDRRFLIHLLPSVAARAVTDDAIKGVTLNKKKLNALVLHLPPLREQRRIAGVLDTLNEQVRKTEQIIAKLKLSKSGLLEDLLTRGIDGNGTLRPRYADRPDLYSDSDVGQIPKIWKVGRLDEFAIRGSGHTPNKNIASYWNGGIRWVSLADSSRLDHLFIYDTDKQISELGLANSSAVKHPPGTVILSRDAGVGKSAILSEEMAVSQHFMAWKCGPQLNNIYLYYWLQYNKPRFEAIAMGSTIKTIGLPYFKKLRIAIPPRGEQDAVANRMLQIDELLVTSAAQQTKLGLISQGMASDLLTGRVRVPVEVRP